MPRVSPRRGRACRAEPEVARVGAAPPRGLIDRDAAGSGTQTSYLGASWFNAPQGLLPSAPARNPPKEAKTTLCLRPERT